MNVTRVHTDTGSHIEPPLEENWSDAEQLHWLAAVVTCDTGVPVAIRDCAFIINGVPTPGYFSVRLGRSSSGPYRLQDAWTFLNGVTIGVQQQREHVG